MISKSKKSISLILDDDFTQYCELNNIEDQKSFAKRIFNQGFSIIKYGETPNGVQGKEKIVEKEVIKEVIVEKIVEVEKLVEIIKEIPVEKIVEVIKEVPVKTKDKIQVVTKEVIKEVFVDKIILPMTVPPVNSKKFNVGLFAKSLYDIKDVFMEIALIVLINGELKVRAFSFKFKFVIVEYPDKSGLFVIEL